MAKRDDEDLDADDVAEEADAEEADALEADEAGADEAGPDEAEMADAEADEAMADAAEADADVADEAEADEADEAEADAGADEEEPDEEEPDEPQPYEEEKPRKKPKVTALTLVLCFLNVIAAAGFLFMLMLDFSKRQAYAFAAAQNEFHLIGLGVAEDREGITAGVEALPRPKLSQDAIAPVFRGRGGSGATAPFMSVEDGLTYHLYGMPEDLLKQELKDLGDPVGSVEEEMKRLQGRLPGDIQEVVKKQAERLQKATDLEKQRKAAMLLYPLCRTPMQVEKVEAAIKRAQGAMLDSMVADAVERRILADILLPVEMFRSSDQPILENCADAGAVGIDKLRKLLNDRLAAAASATHDGSVHFGKEWDNQKRWTIEKRQNAAFLLVSLAYARNHLTPLAKEESPFLYPNGLDRAQRISGLYDFTEAASAYDKALRKWEERVIAAIALDRDGFQIQVNNDLKRSASFAEKHAALQFRIRQVQQEIREADGRITDLQEQIDRATKLVAVRTKDLAALEARIKQERAITKMQIAELRQLQRELFDNQKILADAAEINARLLARINKLSGVKGTKP